jgi:hypothetical protein
MKLTDSEKSKVIIMSKVIVIVVKSRYQVHR